MKTYADRKGVQLASLKFQLDDSSYLGVEDTCKMLDLEDGDTINVRLNQAGC